MVDDYHSYVIPLVYDWGSELRKRGNNKIKILKQIHADHENKPSNLCYICCYKIQTLVKSTERVLIKIAKSIESYIKKNHSNIDEGNHVIYSASNIERYLIKIKNVQKETRKRLNNLMLKFDIMLENVIIEWDNNQIYEFNNKDIIYIFINTTRNHYIDIFVNLDKNCDLIQKFSAFHII